MKTKRLWTLIGSICLTLVLAALLLPACAKEEAPAEAPASKITPITLKFAHYFSPVDFRHETVQHWANLVSQRSDGVITVEIYPAASLVKGKEGLTSTAAGVCDLYSIYNGYVTGVVPLANYFDLPFPRYEDETMIAIFHEARYLFDPVFEAQNVKVLGIMSSSGDSDFYFTKPIHTLEDIDGLKMRGAGGILEKGMKALGVSVAFMSASEQYTALQTKTVDGTTTTYMSYTSWKLWEVAPYWLKHRFSHSLYWPLMNLDTWNKLSPEAQELILDVTADTEKWMMTEVGKVNDGLMNEMRQYVEEEYILPDEELNRWRTKVAHLVDDYVAQTGSAGQELVNIAEEVLK